MRDQRITVGRLDSRFEGKDADAVGEQPDFDPSYAAIQGPFTAALNQYVRAELKYESDLPYEILTGRVYPWNFEATNEYLNVAETLRQALNVNRDLRVFVANGYYDLATPYFATDYTFNHMGLEPPVNQHISMGYYQAGHMMYISKTEITKLKADLSHFIDLAIVH